MSRIVSTCYIISIINEIIYIKSKAVSLALKLLQAALRWQASLDVPMRSWSDLLLDTAVLQGSTGRWKVSHTHSCDCKLKAIPRTRRDCNHRKWEPGTNYFLWDTDAASVFAYSNTGINLPECFPPFPSNFAAVQIQFSPCVRNESFSTCLCIWVFEWVIFMQPTGMPKYLWIWHTSIFSWKLPSAAPCEGLSAAQQFNLLNYIFGCCSASQLRKKKPLQEVGHKKKLPNYPAFQWTYS